MDNVGESWILNLMTSSLGRAAEEKHNEEEAEVAVMQPQVKEC